MESESFDQIFVTNWQVKRVMHIACYLPDKISMTLIKISFFHALT